MLWLNNKPKLIAHINPKCKQTEDFRALRTNIEFVGEPQDRKVLMLTSTYSREGKSTVACNLAVVYAQLGRKVLLIDGDLRTPSLHRYFSVSSRFGMTNVLAEDCRTEDAWVEVFVPNLFVLLGGAPADFPAELIASDKMERLIDDCRQSFDVVLIDASPTLEISDAQMLSGHCDGVIFIINKGKVKREAAREALAKLENAQAKVIGIVLNSKRGRPRRVIVS